MSSVSNVGNLKLTYGRPDIVLREVTDLWRTVSLRLSPGHVLPRPDLVGLREQINSIWPRKIGVRLFELGFETIEIATYSKWCNELQTPGRPHKTLMLSIQEQRAESGQHYNLVQELIERRRSYALNDPAFKDHELLQGSMKLNGVPLWFRVAHQPVPISPDQPDRLCASFAIRPDHWGSFHTWFTEGVKNCPARFSFTTEDETPTTLPQMILRSECKKFAWYFYKESQVKYPPDLAVQILFGYPDRFPVAEG